MKVNDRTPPVKFTAEDGQTMTFIPSNRGEPFRNGIDFDVQTEFDYFGGFLTIDEVDRLHQFLGEYLGKAAPVPIKPQWSCPPEVIRAANSLERAIKTAPHVSSDIMRALNSLQLQLTATGLQLPAAPEGE